MGLFSKKLDIKDDRLIRRFAPDKGYYYVQSDGTNITEIGVDQLNKRSLKELKRATLSLNEDKNLQEMELSFYRRRQRADKMKQYGLTTVGFEVLGEVKGSIAPMLKDQLEELVEEKDVLLGIHRTKQGTSIDDIADILNNGLRIDGHMGGMTASTKSLSDTVSYYYDNRTIIKEAMYANIYKNSSGSIIIRIPDEDLADPNKVYISDGDSVRVDPKYILGYIPVTSDHHLERMYTKKDISELKQQNIVTKQTAK